jgi:hypothetical protein
VEGQRRVEKTNSFGRFLSSLGGGQNSEWYLSFYYKDGKVLPSVKIIFI